MILYIVETTVFLGKKKVILGAHRTGPRHELAARPLIRESEFFYRYRQISRWKNIVETTEFLKKS